MFSFCVEEQKGLAYHLEGLRVPLVVCVPQFGNHCHRPSARNKSWSPCSVKTTQYRVRKCIHEGKPRATNRSRVNPITVQCKVGNHCCHSVVTEKY